MEEELTNCCVRSGCQACGKDEIEKGCNGEGRIQGGIATVPGFGWWPIKAYRPCPAYLATGGRYKRRGQSMDEVASGGLNRAAAKAIDDTKLKTRYIYLKEFCPFHFALPLHFGSFINILLDELKIESICFVIES